MKRTSLRRKTPLKAREGLKRASGASKPSKPLGPTSPRSRRRKRARFERQYFSVERVEFIKGLRCVYCSRSPCENHHEPTRGAGGVYTDISPLCPGCHFMRHRYGAKTFWGAQCITSAESNARTQELWEATDGD